MVNVTVVTVVSSAVWDMPPPLAWQVALELLSASCNDPPRSTSKPLVKIQSQKDEAEPGEAPSVSGIVVASRRL